MYRGFEAQREQLDADAICDVRYEEVVSDPIGQIEAVYDTLQLGDFEQVRDRLKRYVDSQRDYRPNLHRLAPEVRERIDEVCGDYQATYGYEPEQTWE